MKFLNVITGDTDELYEIKDIVNIVCDYAQNVFSEPDMNEKGLKPLEMVTVIRFANGNVETYRTAGIEMSFD